MGPSLTKSVCEQPRESLVGPSLTKSVCEQPRENLVGPSFNQVNLRAAEGEFGGALF